MTAPQLLALGLGCLTFIGIIVPGLTRIMIFLLVAAVCTNYMMWFGVSATVSEPLRQFRYFAGL